MFVQFDSAGNTSGLKNIVLSIVGRNFGGSEQTSAVVICHPGFTKNEDGNFTGCFVPSISEYTHTAVKFLLGDDVEEEGTGPFPGNITLVSKKVVLACSLCPPAKCIPVD